MQRADLQLLVNQRKPACVLDPALLLCHAQGPLLATRLTQVMEPWLTRSFWQALDASELLAHGASHGGSSLSATALSTWIAMREGTELGTSLFRWIGDRLAESQLQDSVDTGALARYERLAEAMEGRCEARMPRPAGWCTRFDAETASRDALVLSATLDGALLLTAADAEPAPVRAAQAAGLNVKHIAPSGADSLFGAERALVCQSLAAAGLAPLLEEWPRLAVLHALAPDDDDLAGDTPAEPWATARVWWYAL